MNRRTFLKSIATVCGAVVVCPGELVKLPVKHLWMRGKDGSCIEGEDIPYGIPYYFGISSGIINNKSAPFIIGAHDEKIQTPQRPNPLRSQTCDPPG